MKKIKKNLLQKIDKLVFLSLIIVSTFSLHSFGQSTICGQPTGDGDTYSEGLVAECTMGTAAGWDAKYSQDYVYIKLDGCASVFCAKSEHRAKEILAVAMTAMNSGKRISIREQWSNTYDPKNDNIRIITSIKIVN